MAWCLPNRVMPCLRRANWSWQWSATPQPWGWILSVLWYQPTGPWPCSSWKGSHWLQRRHHQHNVTIMCSTKFCKSCTQQQQKERFYFSTVESLSLNHTLSHAHMRIELTFRGLETILCRMVVSGWHHFMLSCLLSNLQLLFRWDFQVSSASQLLHMVNLSVGSCYCWQRYILTKHSLPVSFTFP